MGNKTKRVLDNIKQTFLKLFEEEPIDTIKITEPLDEETSSVIDYIKDKLNFKKKKITNNKSDQTNRKKYLNRDQVILIASEDKCLKKSMYKEAIDHGYNYGIIEFNNFYTTLVKYRNSLYWYIKVLDGKYGFKEHDKNKKGYFDEYSNIRCLVNATTGKFIYIDEEFDTRNIIMISDDEFLEIIFDFKR